jgi:hypothetical protein
MEALRVRFPPAEGRAWAEALTAAVLMPPPLMVVGFMAVRLMEVDFMAEEDTSEREGGAESGSSKGDPSHARDT